MLFQQYHARNLADALQFAAVTILIAGSGAMGALLSQILASMGFNLILLDRDELNIENLHRHSAKKKFVAWPKAEATVRSFREEFPAEQTFLYLTIDLAEGADAEIRALLEAADIVVGATGIRATDMRLNQLCRLAGVPYLSVALWPTGVMLGHAHLSPWTHAGTHTLGRYILACVSCSGAAGENEQPLEAQPGAQDVVLPVALLAVRIISALCVPNIDPRAHWLAAYLHRGENFFVVRRADNGIVGVNTEDAVRANCSERDGGLAGALRTRRQQQLDRAHARQAFTIFAGSSLVVGLLFVIARVMH